MKKSLITAIRLAVSALTAFTFFSACIQNAGDNSGSGNNGSGESSSSVSYTESLSENQVSEEGIDFFNKDNSSSNYWLCKTFSIEARAGYEIEMQFSMIPEEKLLKPEGKELKSEMQFYYDSSSWKGCNFSNITFSAKLKWGDDNSKVTCICFDRSKGDCTIKIKLNSQEASNISTGGLILWGYGVTLKSIKYTKRTYSIADAATLEEQYDLRKELRKDTIDYYRNTVGYKLPIIYVTVLDQQEVVEKEYYETYVDVYDENGTRVLSKKKAGVKVRGNSTASGDWVTSLPYRIKFNKKQTMLGLHNGKEYKSWVLLNTNGGSDYVGFNLAREIYKTGNTGYNYYGSDCRFVHVFVNNQYKGMRLLCEQSQSGSERVDIAEPEENNSSTKIGYMLDLDNYSWSNSATDPTFSLNKAKKIDFNYKGSYYSKDRQTSVNGVEIEHETITVNEEIYPEYAANHPDVTSYTKEGYQFTDIYGNQIQNNSVSWDNGTKEYVSLNHYLPDDWYTIKSDTWNDAQREFIAKWMNNVWEISYQAIEHHKLYTFDANYDLMEAGEYSDSAAKDLLGSLIDLESLANEMILEELVRDNDVGAGSFYMAVDFTKASGEKYSRLTFECPWDFNWGFSNYTGDTEFYGSKPRYFAGAYQPLYVLDDGYERSNFWFTLFNKADWFRTIARNRWNQIGAQNLLEVCSKAETDTEQMQSIERVSCSTPIEFLKKRIPEIDSTLWKE